METFVFIPSKIMRFQKSSPEAGRRYDLDPARPSSVRYESMKSYLYTHSLITTFSGDVIHDG